MRTLPTGTDEPGTSDRSAAGAIDTGRTGVLPLVQLRRRVPWTQGELAAAAGVAIGTVRAIEREAYSTVRPRVMRALATALGVAPAVVAEFRPSLGLPPAGPGSEAVADPATASAASPERS